jgi:hypothetical protein
MWVHMIRSRRLYEVADIVAGAQLCAARVAQPRGRRMGRALDLMAGRRCPLVLALVVWGAVTAAAGCGRGSGNVDAAAGSDVLISPEAGTDLLLGDTQMPTCAFARTVCDGKNVYACVDKQRAGMVDECKGACSFGRCTTAACASIESAEGVQGCRFYGAQVDNTDADDARPTLLLVSNAGATPATAWVETPAAGGGWGPSPLSETVVVKTGETKRIRISRPLLEVGVNRGGAYRVESDAPVMVVEIVGDDTERTVRSSGGTVLRPLQALGPRYMALTYAGENSLEVARTPGSRDGAGAITIVATAPQTVVHLGVTAVAIAMPGTTLQPRGEGESPAAPFILNDGDVLQVFSIDSAGDLTGSSIDADAAVAVFSGNVFTSYGKPVTGANGGDLVMEQLPPLKSWSASYAGVRLSPQGKCDSFFEGAGAWRVLATDPDLKGNLVTLKAAADVTFEIDGEPPGSTAFVLGHGMARSFKVRGSAVSAPDFELSADRPVLLGQWLDCEPALSWGIDTRFEGSGELPFGVPPGFETEMVVVRTVGKSLLLDGLPLAGDLFRPLAAASLLEVARVPADRLRCPDQWDACAHRLSGQEFGVSWRGVDVVCSYALTVPTRAACALPNATSCPL